MRTPYRILVLPLLLVAGVSLACMVHVGGPALPGPVIPVSTEAIDQVQDTVENARQSTQPGELLTLTFTESQLSSVLASELENRSDPWITSPQVYLEDGDIEIYGQASKGFLAGNVHLTVDISIDENGNPELTLRSGDLGPVALPDWLLDKLSTLLDESLTGTIGPVVTGIRIEGVVIDDGVMVILGRFRE